MMIKKLKKDFFKLIGYEKVKRPYKSKFSLLNSKEFVLEERQQKEEVVNLIQSLAPYHIGKDLIRIGPNGDGGYLVPDDLNDIKACFSPGVSTVSGFEEDCYDLGMQLFLADKSVDKANLDSKHNFIAKFIGCTNNKDFITMDDWVKQNVSDKGDLLLQMDIEGSEYIAFLNMSDSLLSRFRIMVVEFHDLHKLWNKGFFEVISTVFMKILQTHICVHIHPNNCCGLDVQEGIEIPRVAEFTFIRKDRVDKKNPVNKFPHPSDFDNTNYPQIDLPAIWYKGHNDL